MRVRSTAVSLLVMASIFSVRSVSAQPAGFEADAPGAVPKGWTVTMTGKGTPKWAVVADETAPSKPNALQQSGTATYPLLILDGSSLKDGVIETRFKAISGNEDRAAGIIWRAKDANNYYVVRANALEDNVVLYKTVTGKRSSLPTTKGDTYGVKTPVPPNVWHTLRVEVMGSLFKVAFNGKPLFEVDDKTFADAGQVGLWTKADSNTLFDEFSFTPAK
jgi:hypothetical protein